MTHRIFYTYTCPVCGEQKDLEPGQPEVCRNCQREKKKKPICPRCENSEIRPEDNFCIICGLALRDRLK